MDLKAISSEAQHFHLDYWKDLYHTLSECSIFADANQEGDFESWLFTILCHLKEVVETYSSILIKNCEEEKVDNEYEKTSNHNVFTSNEPKNTKQIILVNRYALRYALGLFGLESKRSIIQELAVCKLNLHMVLSNLLSMTSCDSKCQHLAAKSLCNVGTSNCITSLAILNDIKPSPSKHYHPSCTSIYDSDSSTSSKLVSWSEMIHVTASTSSRGQNRVALAAIVASLHNFIVAICDGTINESVDEYSCFDLDSYITDSILLCNLVRYILPKDTIMNRIGEEEIELHEKDMADEGTFWISLLLELLFAKGLFQQIYQLLGLTSTGEISSDSDSDIQHSVTPEQIVLLNCYDNSIQSYVEDYTKNISKFNERNKNPLGGASNQERVVKETVYFIANELMTLRKRCRGNNVQKEELYQGEMKCIYHSVKTLTDILGTALSISDEDDNICNHCYASIRMHLGQNIPLLTESIIELGYIVEKLGIQNRGVKARELVVSNDDQHMITGLVRIIGNLCYKCKANQDLVRETRVPFHNGNNFNQDRSGLHVILTCTSFAYGCFTLREWGIVAIRNILHKNEANQKEIAKLEAQQVVNTPELEKLGVKLNLDKEGKISVQKHSDTR